MAKHVQDETLLDRLFHAVGVKGVMPDRFVALRIRIAEDLQRLVLGRGGKGEVAGVGEELARLHQAVDLILVGLLFRRLACLAQRLGHGCGGAAALARMGLVDDDGKAAPAMFVADLVENERELLDRRDDDLLAGLDEPSQVARTLGVPHRRAHLGVFPDRVSDLPVEDAAIGDDDDGVEDWSVVPFQPDQLMGQPCNRIAFAAARRVLDQVTLACPVRTYVGQEPAHRVELVVARPDLDSPLLPCLGVLRFHDLGVVLQDVGQAPAGQHLAPQVVRP